MADALVEARGDQRRATARTEAALTQALDPLYPALYEALAELAAAGGQLRMRALADRMGISTSGLTRLLNRAVREGWVQREPLEGDNRGRLASLTVAGSKVVVRLWPKYVAALEEAAS